MRSLAAILAVLLSLGHARAERPAALIDEHRILPSEHPAIDYWNAEPEDAVARLQQRLRSGDAALEHDPRFGYLPAVLEALDVPVSSQALVFSKTSFQAVRIVPRMPRAIYHSPDVAVGWVRGGDVLEVASLDPKLGVVFYTLEQAPSPRPTFALRTTECISCHVGPATLGTPGLLVRSVHPDRSGTPRRSPSFITDHRSPLEERWGGWYVSGLHGSQRHLGNLLFEQDGRESTLVGDRAANLEDLEPYVSPYDYLRSTSDIASLMVLEHQTRMTNLIVRLGYETRIALHEAGGAAKLSALSKEARTRVRKTAEELLRYMLFVDEAPLDEPVRGHGDFVRDFEGAGRKDAQGRSLRELDLERRLMRYPCSYMIDSAAFTALPGAAKSLVYRKLWAVLTGKDHSTTFRGLSAEDRRAILEILRETRNDLPKYWTAKSKG